MSESDLITITHTNPGRAWLESAKEEILEPGLRIIDAHHHFSEHWGGYFPAELIADLESGHKVVGTVYIQCGLGYREAGPDHLKPVGETETVVSLVKKIPPEHQHLNIAAGIIGYADLALGDSVADVLQAHMEAGEGRFKGIRCSGARDEHFKHGVLPRPPEGLYVSRDFQAGFARLQEHGLSFESWLYHPQLGDLLDLARKFPSTPIMINHVGGTLGVGPYEGKRDQVMQAWKPMMKSLAACENVYVKLGGLGTAVYGYRFHEQPTPSSEEIARAWGPYFHTCIEYFGADRCLFESNYPVDRAAGSYPVLWNAFKRIAASASPAEKAAMFHDNAARFYRLPMKENVGAL